MGTTAAWPGRPRGGGRAPTAADPLPLALPPVPSLPAPLPLEMGVPCAGPFDGEDWLFSPDWQGTRCLLVAARDGGVRLRGERLEDISSRFPEVVSAAGALRSRVAVLDGTIAVLDAEGRPDLAALARRRLAGTAAPEAVFLATDLLHLDGAPTVGWPLERRLEALRGLLPPPARIQLPEPVRGEGTALAEAARERGLPALLARRAGASYHPGLASRDRLRIDLTGSATCILGGVAVQGRGGYRRRLVLAERVRGRLIAAGVVGAALPREMAGWLDSACQQLARPSPALDGVDVSGVRWLRPELTVTVRHRGRDGRGQLLEPVLVAVRDDVDPRWCDRREPVDPPCARQAPAGGFRPTVLVTLPLSAEP